LTTRGLDRRALRFGQHFRCGTATIQLTELRLPCDTISVYGKGIQEAIYDARAIDFNDNCARLAGLLSQK